MEHPAEAKTPTGAAVAAIDGRDGERTFPAYAIWPGVIPYPPPRLLASVGAPTLENFIVVGEAWFQVLRRYLTPQATVLDIGCGCGRTARYFAGHPGVRRYVGFDVIAENIAWCERFVRPADPLRMQFLHVDLYSADYNPQGTIRAEQWSFPGEDASVDLVFASSVFTHVLEPEARRYLAETRRVLSRRGYAVISLLTEALPHDPYTGTVHRIDVYPPYWLEMAREAGLVLAEARGDLCGQNVFVLERDDAERGGWLARLGARLGLRATRAPTAP